MHPYLEYRRRYFATIPAQRMHPYLECYGMPPSDRMEQGLPSPSPSLIPRSTLSRSPRRADQIAGDTESRTCPLHPQPASDISLILANRCNERLAPQMIAAGQTRHAHSPKGSRLQIHVNANQRHPRNTAVARTFSRLHARHASPEALLGASIGTRKAS